MRKLYLLRHGETEYNKKKIVQGQLDSHLNTTGLKQAQAFYDYYKDHPFDKLYVSPLFRARETIEIFNRNRLLAEIDPNIAEISFGVNEGKYPTVKMKKAFAELVHQWCTEQYDAKVEGGESPNEAAERATHFLEKLKKTQDREILICSHGRFLRIMMCILMHKPLKEMDNMGTRNTGLHIVEWDGVNPANLLLYNNTDHLKINK